MRRFIRLTTAVIGLLLTGPSRRARAQSPPMPFQGPTISLSLDYTANEEYDLDFYAVRATTLRPRGVGTEVTVLLPRFSPALLGIEFGPAATLSRGNVALLLRGGLGFMYLGLLPEAYLGAAAVVRVVGPVGVRLDLGNRWLLSGHTWLRASTAGIGLTFMSEPRPPRCSP